MDEKNIDLLKFDNHNKTNRYLEAFFSFSFSPQLHYVQEFHTIVQY